MARTGVATVLKGNDSIVVTHTIAANSFIGVSLTAKSTSAAGGANFEWVEKVSTTGFVVHMSDAVQTDTALDYVVI